MLDRRPAGAARRPVTWAADGRPACGRPGGRRRGRRAAAPPAGRGRRRAPEPGVRHLHLRLHRPPKGVVVAHRGLANLAPPRPTRFAVRPRRPGPAVRLAELRRLGAASCAWPLLRGGGAGGRRRRADARRRRAAPRSRPSSGVTARADPAGRSGHGRRTTGPPPACGRCRRRRRVPAATLSGRWAAGARLAGDQRLRPDRGHRRRHLVPSRPGAGRARLPIGRPSGNTRAYVLDARAAAGAGRGAPASCTSPAPGWPAATWAGPGLTAERFVADPFGAPGEPDVPHRRPGALAAATASWSSSAAPTTRSRSAASGSSWARSRPRCAAHPAVAEAVVVARQDRPGGQAARRVRGRRRPAQAPTRRELRDAPRPGAARLHGARRRSSLLDALPLTANGKVDRAALPAPDPRAGAGGRVRRARRHRPRRALAGIWADVLGRGPGRRRGQLLRPSAATRS